jgi:phosphate transport system protein
MERRFEADLKDLKNRILAMGDLVEKAIGRSNQALAERNMAHFTEVHALEKKINEAHIAVDHACVQVLARLSPMAADLRLIVAVIKINSDLERMGDQAVNISYNAEHYLNDGTIGIDLDLPAMGASVQAMVRKALDAFMRSDTRLAQEVLESDDEVDEFKNRVFERLIPYMKAQPDKIEAALDLILIARNLERMGDHATNIAEDVIFACTGEDVRHGIGHIS